MLECEIPGRPQFCRRNFGRAKIGRIEAALYTKVAYFGDPEFGRQNSQVVDPKISDPEESPRP